MIDKVTVQVIGYSVGHEEWQLPAAIKGGLAIHRAVTGFGWAITHVRTGLSVAVAEDILRAAQLRNGLIEICNWDVSEMEILTTLEDQQIWYLVKSLINHLGVE